MLDPHATDLVDAVARLCVLRTEDYTLLLTAHRRTVQQQQQQVSQYLAGHSPASPLDGKAVDATGHAAAVSGPGESGTQLRDNKAYIRYLTEEVQAREQLRLATEKAWLAAVRRWAQCFAAGQAAPPDDVQGAGVAHAGEAHLNAGCTSPSLPCLEAPAVWGFWASRQEAAFQQMYAMVLRQSYELHHTDLANTPFARMRKCQQLYDARAAPPAPLTPSTASPSDGSRTPQCFAEAHIHSVHRLFFPAKSPSAATATAAFAPSRLLAATHPIRTGDPVATFSDASRTRLQASHHVWLVLFFLWCHVVAAGGQAATATPDSTAVAWQAAALLDPAESFLSSQARQLRTLLETAHASAEVGHAAP